jgi:hypothetical protein
MPSRLVLQRRGRPSHGLVVFLHLLFKLMSLVLYIFGWFLTSSFIACFILIMILLSADFWIVKNVSGRLLAGLRKPRISMKSLPTMLLSDLLQIIFILCHKEKLGKQAVCK